MIKMDLNFKRKFPYNTDRTETMIEKKKGGVNKETGLYDEFYRSGDETLYS
jgi:hypothetical protein